MAGKPVRKFLFIFLLLLPVVDYAQLGIGGGFEYGAPIFINSPVFAGRPSIGIGAILSYMPPAGRLFPSFAYLKKNILVPVNNGVYDKQDDFAAEDDFVLNLNYKPTDKEHYTLVFAGIGLANIVPEHHLNDRAGNSLELRDTGSVTKYPLMQIGCIYMHRILPNSNFYVGAEASMKYIRMHSDNVYYIWQKNNFTKASIAGNAVIPGVQVYLQYFFAKESEN